MAGWGNIRGDRDPRPITSGVKVLVGVWDCGPCEPGAPSAFCPHCGSGGRHVIGFVCENGEQRGAMRGCLKLFRMSRLAAQQLDSLKRFKDDTEAHARGSRKWPAASWDQDIYSITAALEAGEITADEAVGRIQGALDRRTAFLKRKQRTRR